MSASEEPLLIAHRGESVDAPENTLAAIRLAWERGARAVEIDVRLTADGEVVVVHDANLWRVCRRRVQVARATAAEVRLHEVRDSRWKGERVPLLAQVLDGLPAAGRLFVEIKSGPEILPALESVLRQSRLRPEQVVVMAFDRPVVAAAVRVLPGWEVALLLTARQCSGRRRWARALGVARGLGCASVDVQVHRRLDATAVAAAHAAGLRVYSWTINRVPTARRLAAAGIDGITTDRCAWMRERLLKK